MRYIVCFWVAVIIMPQLQASTVRVAVAANFYLPMQSIAAMFETQTGHNVEISAASTGALYAQITQGAPYHVFFAADQRRPALLEAEGLTVPQTRFTYAQGELVLWSPDAELIDAQATVLTSSVLPLLAIANPNTAPYGQAALEVWRR